MDNNTETAAPQTFAYKAEMKQLLHLIIHSLYTHPEIFLRELISNASDALNKARFYQLTHPNARDASAALQIEITLDADANTLTISDTGIGMTQQDLTERIGTVASSGTLAFLEELKQSGKKPDAQMIGQFGVGFYASFMVAEQVTIETCHADPEAQGYRWQSDGAGTYTVEPIDRTARGTTITLTLKEDAKEFSQDYRVRQIIQKYSNFVDFPILLEDEQANTVKALWRKQKDDITEEERDEFYKFISGDYQAPLGDLHLHIEGSVFFDAMLFIPATAPPGLFRDDYERRLHLYANNVFIQDDCEALLPEYLRFVRGVVDTEDLPLNVSRETTQNSPVLSRINKVLTSRILGLLEDWAISETEKFATFHQEFGPLFKMGLNADEKNKERITKLLRFESTRTEGDERVSLDDYVSRMQPSQKEIYYLLGEHRDTVLRNPLLEYFRRHDLEVLLLTDPVDVFTMPSLHTFGDYPLQSIEKADLDLEADPTTADDALTKEQTVDLLTTFKQVLGEEVEDVVASKRLVDSAATLVIGKQGFDKQMERMMRMMDQSFAGSKKILEVNLAHPLLKNMARLQTAPGHEDHLKMAILQVYEGALLLDGSLKEPISFVQRMTDLMVKATAS